MTDRIKLEQKLAAHGQSQLLTADADEAYLAELDALDLDQVDRLYAGKDIAPTQDGEIAACSAVDASAMTAADRAECEARGRALLREGKVAVLTMAGGQGTRLGYNGPKGCYDVGVGVSLFGLLAERIRRLQADCGGVIPWYIMTSVENNDETVAFFRKNGWFGLNETDVIFFRQGVLPLLDTDGKILLTAPNQIAKGSDGNGGVFAALKNSGALADMANRGILHVFFCGIDNALARPAEPLFVGFFDRDGAPCASKSVAKSSPEERVGVFCTRNGRPCVIEYTELTPEMRTALAADGSLAYGDANIVTHLMRMDALQTVCGMGLPMHTAFKAIKHYDPAAGFVTPPSPNGYKFESFIFDAFAALDRMAILRVDREREFAPVKNAAGNDSPATALALLIKNGYSAS